ncbi:zona pellucida-like domain-containing protein 1 [Trichomycterus rosablanca]|uniref:zona pellucida-like domain-containing protein 1 n=1 Tax=Trichomycterus rosablanca TaxID=2290929 RepID=UPI002F355153
MWWTLLVCVNVLIVHCEDRTGLGICRGHSTYRKADDSDFSVTCGADNICLSIVLCSIYYEGFNESLMALNAKFNIPVCYGVTNLEASTPILKFNFSIFREEMSLCGSSLELSDQVDADQYSNTSKLQFVNISGSINSWKPSNNVTLQREPLVYQFSCLYPSQYLVNNTEVSMFGTSLPVRKNKGSFVSALNINLFTNRQYTTPLKIPQNGLKLKTRIYVQVKAAHLTNRFNVLLDRCYTTTSPYPTSKIYYDLFVGCKRDGQTVLYLNGVSQEARFSFEAFHFLEHQNLTISTYYLHCVTRLCENTTCISMLPKCIKPAKMALQTSQYSENVETISSGPIKTRRNSDGFSLAECSKCVEGAAILSCLLGFCCAGLIVLIKMYMRHRCVISR